MEIYTLLDHEGVKSLRSEFAGFAEGIDLKNFVISFLLHLPKLDLAEEELVRRLISIFSQADANDDGAVEWQEFTQFCIDMGVAATESAHLRCAIRYIPRAPPTLPPSLRKAKFSLLSHLPEINKIFLCEPHSPEVHVLDCPESSSSSLSSSSSSSASSNTDFRYLHSFRLDVEEESRACSVESVAFADLGSLKLLVLAAGDGRLHCMDLSCYDILDFSLALAPPRPLLRVPSPEPQTHLCYAAFLQSIVSCARSAVFHLWRLATLPSFSITLSATVSHPDSIPITALLSIPSLKLILTAGHDGVLHLWRPAQGGTEEEKEEELAVEHAGTRVFHRRPVRLLASDGKHIAVSVGFDLEAAGWDLSSGSLQPLFRLAGAGVPVSSVGLLRDGGRLMAVSADEAGGMRLWDLEDAGAGEMGKCVDSWTVGVKDAAVGEVTVVDGGRTLLVRGQRIVAFERERAKGEGEGLVCAVVNQKALAVVMAVRREVKVVSGISGEIVSHFRGVSRKEITALCVDAGGKRLILADQSGHVCVVNQLSGAVMKHAQILPKCEISHLLFCSHDKLIITASWDRTLRVWDERAPNDLTLLREIREAVDADVSAMAYDRQTGILAVAAEDASLRLWDFQFLSCLGHIDLQGNTVTALSLHKGILVAVDTTRRCAIFQASPVRLLHACRTPCVPTCLQLRLPLLLLADDTGCLHVLRLPKLSSPSTARSSTTINPYRKSTRIFNTSRPGLLSSFPTATLPDAQIQLQWKAHSASIRSLQLMGADGATPRLLSSGADDYVRLWTAQGALLGVVWAGQRLGEASLRRKWDTGTRDMSDRAAAETADARRLIEIIRADAGGAEGEELCALLKRARAAAQRAALEDRQQRELKLAQIAEAIEDARKIRTSANDEGADILRSFVKGGAPDAAVFRRSAALGQIGQGRQVNMRRKALQLKVRLHKPVDKNGLYPNLSAALKSAKGGSVPVRDPRDGPAGMSDFLAKPYKRFLNSGLDGKVNRRQLEALPSAGGGVVAPEWRRFAQIVKRDLDEGQSASHQICPISEEVRELVRELDNYAPEGAGKKMKELLKEMKERQQVDLTMDLRNDDVRVESDARREEMDIEGYTEESRRLLKRRVDKTKYFGGHSRTEVSHVAHVFKSLDLNNDGVIGLDEYTHHLRHSQMQGSFREIIDRSTDIFRRYDADDAGALAIEEMAEIVFTKADHPQFQLILSFMRSISPSPNAPKAHSSRANLFRVFCTYDLSLQGKIPAYLVHVAIRAALCPAQKDRLPDLTPWTTSVDFEEFVRICTRDGTEKVYC